MLNFQVVTNISDSKFFLILLFQVVTDLLMNEALPQKYDSSLWVLISFKF